MSCSSSISSSLAESDDILDLLVFFVLKISHSLAYYEIYYTYCHYFRVHCIV